MDNSLVKQSQPNELVVRPQSGSAISTTVESQRAIAEVQAALTVAAARPRDEMRSIERINISCQRPGLAEKAEYVYSKGGQEISGPTIDLLTVIANHWGNIQFGFRELSQRDGISDVEAFAWDLETNSKRSVQFSVPHLRHTRSGSTRLTDPREIYETVANYAQRRVRACLEAIIPPDVVEDAVYTSRETMNVKTPVTPEGVAKMVAAYEANFGVTKEQLEARLQRRIDTMQPAQFANLRRIYKSMADGMSKPTDWFAAAEPTTEAAAESTATVKDRLKKATPAVAKAAKPKAAPKAEPKVEPAPVQDEEPPFDPGHDPSEASESDVAGVDEGPDPVVEGAIKRTIEACTDKSAVMDAVEQILKHYPDYQSITYRYRDDAFERLRLARDGGPRKSDLF